MDKTQRKPYESPRLTVVEIRSEHGYAISGLTAGFLKGGTSEDNTIEDRRGNGGFWGGGEWF